MSTLRLTMFKRDGPAVPTRKDGLFARGMLGVRAVAGTNDQAVGMRITSEDVPPLASPSNC